MQVDTSRLLVWVLFLGALGYLWGRERGAALGAIVGLIVALVISAIAEGWSRMQKARRRP